MDILVSPSGQLIWNGKNYPCRLGKAGVVQNKREGDGRTPIGRFPLRCLYYRPDRLAKPTTSLPSFALSPRDGWCDDPAHPDYNRFVQLPHPASCEALWREDSLYDVIVVLGYNDAPPIPGLGSAIFFHVANPEGKPTQGCVALPLDNLLEVIETLAVGDFLSVQPNEPPFLFS